MALGELPAVWVFASRRPLVDATQALSAGSSSADRRPDNRGAGRSPQAFRFPLGARAMGSSDDRGHRNLSQEVVMPIRVVAKGRVSFWIRFLTPRELASRMPAWWCAQPARPHEGGLSAVRAWIKATSVALTHDLHAL